MRTSFCPWFWSFGLMAGLVVPSALQAQGSGGLPNQNIANRATGAAASIHRNMVSRDIGMGQQVINRTPDNAEGVYWQMYNRRMAWLEATYMDAMRSNPARYEAVSAQVWAARAARLEAEKQRLAENTLEIKRRQERIRTPMAPGSAPSASFVGSDLLQNPPTVVPFAPNTIPTPIFTQPASIPVYAPAITGGYYYSPVVGYPEFPATGIPR